MLQPILNKSLGTDASSNFGSGDESSVFGASLCMSVLECPICHKKFQKRNGSINEAIKRGFKIYCSKKCAGIARRKQNNINTISKKICSVCKEEKPSDCFSDNGTGRWLNGRCIKCERILQKLKRNNPILNKDEIFKEIDGTNGQYKIGNYGTIISFGNDIDRIMFKIITPQKCPKGYIFYYIRVNKSRKIVKAHRLVAKYFIDNPENKQQVNHKDSNRDNSCYKNLEWVTKEENRKHAFEYGFACNKGINHPGHKLSEEQVIEIFKSNTPTIELVKSYPVGAVTINNIKAGKIWAHLTKNINNTKN